MADTTDWRASAQELQRWIQAVAHLEALARELARALEAELYQRGGEEHLTQEARVALQRSISSGLLTAEATPGRPPSGINRGVPPE